MKWTLITVMLILGGCQDAHVLSSDGTHVIAYCSSGEWIECTSKACPNGWDKVYAPISAVADGIVRCRP